MSLADPGGWGQQVWRVHQSVMIDNPLLAPPGSQPWAAVMWPEPRAAGGWGRAMMAPGPHGRGYAADRLTPGDVIEFGADYRRPSGRKRFEMVPYRWYGVVMATAAKHVAAIGPFPGPEPARQFAERALQVWRQSVMADTPGMGAVSTPAPALPATRDGSVAAVEVRSNGQVTRVDDPTHGRLVVDAAVFGAAMSTDTAELVDLLRHAAAAGDGPELTGAEPKATLAALAARHAAQQLVIDAETVRTAPLPVVAAGGDAVYYGHPDGQVERVDGQRSRVLRPLRHWSPDGFGWGYDGDGATELAGALLADSTGSADVARRLAARYSRAVIAALPQGQAWSLPVHTVASWAEGAERNTAQRPPIEAASRPGRGRRDHLEAGL